MESCTGGALSNYITNVEGSSKIFLGGYVTYSNERKVECGVPPDVIEKYGVYSLECAIEMARACKANTGSLIGIGVTGTLGNLDESNSDSEVGKIYFCIASDTDLEYSQIQLTEFELFLDRTKQKDFVVSTIFEAVEDFLLKGKC
jgi:PncC family amidohydrolase